MLAVGTVAMPLTGALFQKVFMSTRMLIHEISVPVVILDAVRLVRYRDKTAQGIGTHPRLAVPAHPPADHGHEPLKSRKQL